MTRYDDLSMLPFAAHLRPHAGELKSGENYDGCLFEGSALAEVNAGNSRFLECAFADVSFAGGRCRRSKFHDVWLRNVRMVALDAAETSWLDATFLGGIAAGVQAVSAELRRVRFDGVKFDAVNFRGATLTDVSFENCQLREVDFGGAKLTGVGFSGSQLTAVDFSKVTLEKVDLRGAQRLGISAGHGSLRGAIIDSTQLLDLAPMLAHCIGITVDDT
jgi:uncharacterized protein YjbI with pentapeptide repeats